MNVCVHFYIEWVHRHNLKLYIECEWIHRPPSGVGSVMVALRIIPEYLIKNKERFSYDADALIAALAIVFGNNHFKIGDIFAKQKSGTAMGKRPLHHGLQFFSALKKAASMERKDSSRSL